MSYTSLFKVFSIFAGLGSPLIYFGSTFESGGEWFVEGSDRITVFRTNGGGGTKFHSHRHVKAALGLVGKKKHKSNGLERIAVVDFKNLKIAKNTGSTGITGAIKVAEKVRGREGEFQDIQDNINWKLLGIEGEKVVGYMLVSRLNKATQDVFTRNRGRLNRNDGLQLHHLVSKSEDVEVCKDRAYNLKLMLNHDFRIDWRGNNSKLGFISPKIVGGMPEVRKQMITGCKDGGYFVTSNAYFWLKGEKKEADSGLFKEESSSGINGKVLEVNDKVVNVVYDNIEKIELTLDGLRDSFGHTLRWGEKSKPIVNLQIKQ